MKVEAVEVNFLLSAYCKKYDECKKPQGDLVYISRGFASVDPWTTRVSHINWNLFSD